MAIKMKQTRGVAIVEKSTGKLRGIRSTQEEAKKVLSSNDYLQQVMIVPITKEK
jgi:hypothetical protein